MMVQSKTGVIQHTVTKCVLCYNNSVCMHFCFSYFTSAGFFFLLQMVAAAVLLVWNKTVWPCGWKSVSEK